MEADFTTHLQNMEVVNKKLTSVFDNKESLQIQSRENGDQLESPTKQSRKLNEWNDNEQIERQKGITITGCDKNISMNQVHKQDNDIKMIGYDQNISMNQVHRQDNEKQCIQDDVPNNSNIINQSCTNNNMLEDSLSGLNDFNYFDEERINQVVRELASQQIKRLEGQKEGSELINSELQKEDQDFANLEADKQHYIDNTFKSVLASKRDNKNLKESQKQCRVCLEVDENNESNRVWLNPCKCSGSSKYVHEECLKKWIKQSCSDYSLAECEICKKKFIQRFTYLPKFSCLGLLNRQNIKQTIIFTLLTLAIIAFLTSAVFFSINLASTRVSLINFQVIVFECIGLIALIFGFICSVWGCIAYGQSVFVKRIMTSWQIMNYTLYPKEKHPKIIKRYYDERHINIDHLNSVSHHTLQLQMMMDNSLNNQNTQVINHQGILECPLGTSQQLSHPQLQNNHPSTNMETINFFTNIGASQNIVLDYYENQNKLTFSNSYSLQLNPFQSIQSEIIHDDLLPNINNLSQTQHQVTYDRLGTREYFPSQLQQNLQVPTESSHISDQLNLSSPLFLKSINGFNGQQQHIFTAKDEQYQINVNPSGSPNNIPKVKSYNKIRKNRISHQEGYYSKWIANPDNLYNVESFNPTVSYEFKKKTKPTRMFQSYIRHHQQIGDTQMVKINCFLGTQQQEDSSQNLIQTEMEKHSNAIDLDQINQPIELQDTLNTVQLYNSEILPNYTNKSLPPQTQIEIPQQCTTSQSTSDNPLHFSSVIQQNDSQQIQIQKEIIKSQLPLTKNLKESQNSIITNDMCVEDISEN